MGKSFKCDDEDSLRESAIDFLEHENAITIHVYSKPDCTISKKELQRYGATIAKELSYSKGKDFVACEYNGQKISFRKKRVKISIDMEVYNRANTNPGSFHILEEHLQDINNVTKEQRELLESNINSTKPNESEAALLAHVDTSHDFFRHVGFYLKRAKTLPVTDSLKRNFKEKVKTQTEKARELARSLENHTITLEDAISYMTTYDKMFYNSVMRWKELSIVQGALGEVVGLGLMYQLAREYPIEIVEGAVNEYTHVKELGYRITYKKSGKNMLIAIPGHRKNCEIDNMSLYGGVPIIFESKTKKKHTSRSSFEAQQKFISR